MSTSTELRIRSKRYNWYGFGLTGFFLGVVMRKHAHYADTHVCICKQLHRVDHGLMVFKFQCRDDKLLSNISLESKML